MRVPCGWARRDAGGAVRSDEGPRGFLPARRFHILWPVLRNRTGRHLEAQIFQHHVGDLALTHTGIVVHHLLNELPQILRDRRPSARPRLSAPEQAEGIALPADQGVWLQDEGLFPLKPDSGFRAVLYLCSRLFAMERYIIVAAVLLLRWHDSQYWRSLAHSARIQAGLVIWPGLIAR